MLGWHISVYRLADASLRKAAARRLQGALGGDFKRDGRRLAVWQTGLGGLAWITKMIANGSGVDLGGNGYPNRYLLRARDVVPRVLQAPPGARDVWVFGEGDLVTPGWEGRTTIDEEALRRCDRDDWLLVEAWDES